MQGVHLRKYGVEGKVDFVLYEVDGVDFRTDWTPADGDVIMMRDEAAEEQVTNAAGNANLSTLVTDEGRGYFITLALEDMQAKRIEIFLVDQATKVFLDWTIIIETFGHASAQHAFDLDTATVDVGKWLGQAVTLSTGNKPDVNVNEISDDSGAADNLELQYDGTGLIGDTYPFTQSTGAALGGGISIGTIMASVAVIQGSQQNLSNASTSDDSRWTGDDDGSGAEFIFRCTPASTSGIPVELHFEGYYDEPSGASNGATLQVYNFNTAVWDTIATFTNSGSDEEHEIPLSHAHKAPGGGTLETVAYTIGDVMIKFKQDTTETGNACLLIDYMVVGYVNGLVTASDIVDTWESQSQSDPTGFHVNVKEVNGTAQTANDNSADINDIKAVTDDIKMKDTTISSVDTADTKFILTDGLTANDDVNNAVCSIYDVTGNVWSGPRRVVGYIHSAKLIEIDANTPFPLAVSDRVVIWNVSYATTTAGGAISSGDIDDIRDRVWNATQANFLAEGSTGAKQSRSDRTGR